jgi:hypothetical protein
MPNQVFQHEIHQMLVPELDRVLFHLINDLETRGLLDSTLVIAVGEFGRTPWMNAARGRDHYPNAWSMMMTGCGLKRGIVSGATDAGFARTMIEQVNPQLVLFSIGRGLFSTPRPEIIKEIRTGVAGCYIRCTQLSEQCQLKNLDIPASHLAALQGRTPSPNWTTANTSNL